MERINSEERPDYVKIVNSQGLVYTHEDPAANPMLYRYWRENAYYSFTLDEIVALERAASAVFEMCVEAGEWLLSDEGRPYLRRFDIPVYAMKAVIDSWNEEDSEGNSFGSIYGRFDFRFGGFNHPDAAMRVPMLYEFNADTPTSLVESTIQWGWLENTGHGNDQFNALQERLIDAWRRNLQHIEAKLGYKPVVYFACTNADESHEDEMNTLLMLTTCQLAGYKTATIYTENLWIGEDGRYYDQAADRHLDVVFKLFPWEHMAHGDTSRDLFADMENSGYGNTPYQGGTIWIEPPYKMLWSTKAILPVLWKLFGTDPERSKYLIPAWFADEKSVNSGDLKKGYARKPILSREGADITLVLPNGNKVDGEHQGYGDEGFIVQELALPPKFYRQDEHIDVYTVLGVWMVDGEPAGMGIRESAGPITDNFANFVPHSVVDGPVTYELTPPSVPALATSSN